MKRIFKNLGQQEITGQEITGFNLKDLGRVLDDIQYEIGRLSGNGQLFSGNTREQFRVLDRNKQVIQGQMRSLFNETRRINGK